jgi:hypothetical protein
MTQAQLWSAASFLAACTTRCAASSVKTLRFGSSAPFAKAPVSRLAIRPRVDAPTTVLRIIVMAYHSSVCRPKSSREEYRHNPVMSMQSANAH